MRLNKDLKLIFKSKLGFNIEVIPTGDSNYPGVLVYFNNELVSRTEYDSDIEKVRTIGYNINDSEPSGIIDFCNKEDLIDG